MKLPTEPLTFSPILKRIIWGGRRLGDRLNKPLGEENDYAESWELVDREEDQSIVHGGSLAGMTISQLLAAFPHEIMGRHAEITKFPLLLKYLDCNRVLSVQVHPADEYALKMTRPDLGKTEAWYIVDAEPQSVIYAGLKPGVDRAALADAIEKGQTESVLHSFKPAVGQCVFIPAGTVHALGDGLLVAEVQQSSDTTFRLFDWNRVDAAGKSRPLHIQQSLEVTDYDRGPIHPQTPEPDQGGWERLVDCEKFNLRRARHSSAASRFSTGNNDSPVVLMVTSGRVSVEGEGWESRSFTTGDTVLLPAALGPSTICALTADVNVLEISLP
jgi:mannose-6-phosphate isomerase